MRVGLHNVLITTRHHPSYAESAPLELSEDAAVVLRLVCKPSSSLQEIGFTLESITKVRYGYIPAHIHGIQPASN